MSIACKTIGHVCTLLWPILTLFCSRWRMHLSRKYSSVLLRSKQAPSYWLQYNANYQFYRWVTSTLCIYLCPQYHISSFPWSPSYDEFHGKMNLCILGSFGFGSVWTTALACMSYSMCTCVLLLFLLTCPSITGAHFGSFS